MTTRKKIICLSDDENDTVEENETKNFPRESFISSRIIKNYHKLLLDSDNSLQKFIDERVNSEDDAVQILNVNEKEIEVIVIDEEDMENAKQNKKPKKQQQKKEPHQPVAMDEIKLVNNPESNHPNEVCICLDEDEPITEREKQLEPPSETDDSGFEQFVENTPMRIKIKRLDRIEYFSLLRNNPISNILDEISQRFTIPVPRIILYLNDKIVNAKETPKSLNLSVADIFEILCRNEPNIDQSNDYKLSTKDDPNFIQLCLRDNSKKRITTVINRYEDFRKLAQIYSEEKNIPIDRIILQFDQETISLDAKIDSYDLENDDQIDVLVKS